MSRFSLCLAAAVFVLGTAQGATVTVINNFISGQTPPLGGPGPVAPTFGSGGTDANGVFALGVTYTFTDTTGELYGAPVGFGPINRGLQGPADTTITLTFNVPTTFLSFDLVLGVFANSGGHVTIGGTAAPLTTTGDSSNLSSGAFSSGPLSPFTTAQITFNSNPQGTLYALGNLSYDAPAAAAAIPEPGSLPLLAAGSLLLAALLRFRRSSTSHRHTGPVA
jgi:hypothetical protein